MVKTRSYYTWGFVASALFETVGFAIRSVSAQNPTGGGLALSLYISSTVFLVLGPAFAAGAAYVTFRRLVAQVGQEYSKLSEQVARIFFYLDVASIAVQAAGMSLYGSSSHSTSKYSKIRSLLVAGFVIQLVSFVAFLGLSVDYHLRARRAGQRGEWEQCFTGLYIVELCVLIRSIYRCVEYATSTLTSGPIRGNEAYFYCLDFLPMLIATFAFVIRHPSRYLHTAGGSATGIGEFRESNSGTLKEEGQAGGRGERVARVSTSLV
ncbi:hypothetical protein JCM5353_002704 [Sporobolomyces roseus]